MSRLRLVPAFVIAWAAAAAVLVSAAAPAAAASPKSLGKFGDWEGFVEGEGNARMCYAASLPKRSEHAPKDRHRAYVTVTHRPAEKSFGVVSFTPGYALKKGAPVELQVNAAKFALYAADDSAWSRDDKAVVDAMLKGRNMVFRGLPEKGEIVIDDYDLEGFRQVHEAIDKACGVK